MANTSLPMKPLSMKEKAAARKTAEVQPTTAHGSKSSKKASNIDATLDKSFSDPTASTSLTDAEKALSAYQGIPFRISTAPVTTNKKRKRGMVAIAQRPKQYQYTIENSFSARLNQHYAVISDVKLHGQPIEWTDLRTYKSFRVSGETLSVGDIIYVNGEVVEPVRSDSKTPDESFYSQNWVAKVLDCRASSAQFVYLLVQWLLRPEDIVVTVELLQSKPGPNDALTRQDYHAAGEVIPSNTLEIIEASMTNGVAEGLTHLDENDVASFSRGFKDLAWRQTFNIFTSKFSVLRKICRCRGHMDPDQPPIQCQHDECGETMHMECIEDQVLQDLYRTEILKLKPAMDDHESTYSSIKGPAKALGNGENSEKTTWVGKVTGRVADMLRTPESSHKSIVDSNMPEAEYTIPDGPLQTASSLGVSHSRPPPKAEGKLNGVKDARKILPLSIRSKGKARKVANEDVKEIDDTPMVSMRKIRKLFTVDGVDVDETAAPEGALRFNVKSESGQHVVYGKCLFCSNILAGPFTQFTLVANPELMSEEEDVEEEEEEA